MLLAQQENKALALDAQRASAAKSEFLATMSHEIRTPLHGILGYTDLVLDDTALSRPARAHAERVRNAGSALLTIVDDVLDFSKVEAGEVDLDPRPFAPAALAEGALAIVQNEADRKGLALRAVLDPGLPARLVGDPDRLRQVLLNLLNNAVKFTAGGTVTLRVEHEPEGALHRLRFAVEDTGIGIAEADGARLFQRFSQLDGSIGRRFGGTGLGLAISQRLVGLMGGEIRVRSGEGRGSTFWFTVSLADAEPEAPTAAPVTETGPGARVLLVEDVETNQVLARAMLERAGHRVDVVGDGAEAITAVQTSSYDLERNPLRLACILRRRDSERIRLA